MRVGTGSSSGGGVFLFIWEEDYFSHLMEVITSVPITKEKDSWTYIDGGIFTVRYMFSYLCKKFLPPSPLVLSSVGVTARVWESWTPLKVIIFSWQALLGKLPTRGNLFQRWIIMDGEASCCVFCAGARESENHLFSCPTTWLVWLKIHRWLGLTSVLPEFISSLLESFLTWYRKKKNGFKGVLLV
jgi:hypothetical protein